MQDSPKTKVNLPQINRKLIKTLHIKLQRIFRSPLLNKDIAQQQDNILQPKGPRPTPIDRKNANIKISLWRSHRQTTGVSSMKNALACIDFNLSAQQNREVERKALCSSGKDDCQR